MTAVTTYATLQTRIIEDTNRSGDSTFTSAVPGFIASIEPDLQRRLGRTRVAIGRSTATINQEYEVIPSDFAGIRTFELASDPVYALEYLPPDALTSLKGTYSSTGKPLYYTIIGDEFRFLPVPGESYTGNLIYWRKLTALSSSNTTNWLLLAHPDVYTWGALVYAFQWLQDPQAKADAMNAYEIGIASILDADRQESYGAVLQTRPTVVV